MKITRREHLLALGGALVAGSGSLLRGVELDVSKDDEKERFLRTARIVSVEEIGHGVTHPHRVTMELNGVRHDAETQSVDKPLGPFFGSDGTTAPMRDSWRFNVAAYKIDRLLGLNMVVPAISRKFEDKPSAFSWWADDVKGEEIDRIKSEWTLPDQAAFDRTIAVSRVFDELIINIDRNLSNILITNSYDVVLIDHTRCFIPYGKIRNVENLTRCSRPLLRSMRALQRLAVQKATEGFLTAEEVTSMMSRRDRIVGFFDAKVMAEGEGNVLFG